MQLFDIFSPLPSMVLFFNNQIVRIIIMLNLLLRHLRATSFREALSRLQLFASPKQPSCYTQTARDNKNLCFMRLFHNKINKIDKRR